MRVRTLALARRLCTVASDSGPWRATYEARGHAALMDAYADWAQTYDVDSLRFGYAAPAAAAEAVARHVDDLSVPVLDAGAGTGVVGDALAARGFGNLTGIDTSTHMLDVARVKGSYRELVCADLRDEGALRPGSFAALVCVGTLTPNHIETGGVFRRWLRWVQPGGLVCLSVRCDFWAADAAQLWSGQDAAAAQGAGRGGSEEGGKAQAHGDPPHAGTG